MAGGLASSIFVVPGLLHSLDLGCCGFFLLLLCVSGTGCVASGCDVFVPCDASVSCLGSLNAARAQLSDLCTGSQLSVADVRNRLQFGVAICLFQM